MATATLSKFDYQVRDKTGKMITGQLEADTQAAVASKLTSMGYAPIKIEEVKTSGLNYEINMPGSNRVKLKDLAIFSRQFATMISSGLSLIRALSILQEQTENKKLAETIDEIRTRSRRAPACRRRSRSTRRSSRSSTSRWSAPVRAPACSTRCCCASPRCTRRTSSCAARSSPR
jgi:hypothetical protein